MRDNLKSRLNEAYLLGQRNQRVDDFSSWHDRVDKTDALVRGDYQIVYPDQTLSGGKPVVTNLADTMPRDVARLACEVTPSYHAPVKGDSVEAATNGTLRGVIGEGYFASNRFDLIRPQLVMDMLIAGAAFTVEWTDPSSPYPRMLRVDPRFCFPDVFNGQVQDLLIVHPIKLRVADRLFPDANLATESASFKPGALSGSVEVWEYYGPDECVRGVALMSAGGKPVGEAGVRILKRWKPGTLGAPVQMGQLPSPDGAFRGLVDQVGGSLVAKNRAVNLALEYSSQMTYAPFEAKNIMNAGDPPGPNVIYQHDSSAADGQSFMRRVAPAASSQQLWGLIQYLEAEQRDSLFYPSTRSGEVSVSQGSGSFQYSTMGVLTSLTREVQRILTDMQERAASVMLQLDAAYLDFEKQLLRSVGNKRTYLPSRDIGDNFTLSVEYGPGAGLDVQHADVRILNFFSAGLIPARVALDLSNIVGDSKSAYEERQDEETERIVLQRFAGDPSTSLDLLISTLKMRRDKGGTFIDALVAARELEATSAQNAQVPGAQTAQTGMTSAPTEAGAAQAALEKGGRAAPPQQAGTGRQGVPIKPSGGFTPQPLALVQVR